MKRYYFALTNRCNRACAPCCCYSRPERGTFLALDRFKAILPEEGVFEIQLEGGEPLLHPRWREMIRHAANTGRCIKTTLGTNGTRLPFADDADGVSPEPSKRALLGFFRALPQPFTLKLSINAYLHMADPDLFDKAALVAEVFLKLQSEGTFELVFNVRRRKDPAAGDDAWVVDRMGERGLLEWSNVYFFQRYGFAANDPRLEPPFIIENPVDFYLICPKGRNFGKDLLARSEAMREMP